MPRPRKQGERYRCGKLKPNQHPQDTTANRRQYAISLGKPLNMGTVQAHLFAHKKLNEEQWKTADWYQDEYARYQKALRSPGAPREGTLNGNGYVDEELHEARVRRQIQRFERMRGKLSKLQLNALEMIELQQMDLSLQDDLKSALDAIHKHRA